MLIYEIVKQNLVLRDIVSFFSYMTFLMMWRCSKEYYEIPIEAERAREREVDRQLELREEACDDAERDISWLGRWSRRASTTTPISLPHAKVVSNNYPISYHISNFINLLFYMICCLAWVIGQVAPHARVAPEIRGKAIFNLEGVDAPTKNIVPCNGQIFTLYTPLSHDVYASISQLHPTRVSFSFAAVK